MKLTVQCASCGTQMTVKAYQVRKDEEFTFELACPKCSEELERYRYVDNIWKRKFA